MGERERRKRNRKRKEKWGKGWNGETIPRGFMILQMKIKGRAPSPLSQDFLRTYVSVPEGVPYPVTRTRKGTKRRRTNRRSPQDSFPLMRNKVLHSQSQENERKQETKQKFKNQTERKEEKNLKLKKWKREKEKRKSRREREKEKERKKHDQQTHTWKMQRNL